MLASQRSTRVFARSAPFASTPYESVLQRPGRFVNAPSALAPVQSPPDDGRGNDGDPRREGKPLRLPRQPRPAAPSTTVK